jgi:hypothetical protein
MLISQLSITETVGPLTTTGYSQVIDTGFRCNTLSVQIKITSSGTPTGSINFQASNDGTNFTTLNPNIADFTAASTFAVEDTSVAYRFYRLQFVVTGGTNTFVDSWLGLGYAA